MSVADFNNDAKPDVVIVNAYPDKGSILQNVTPTGATNAVPVKGWPQLSLETVTANPPDIVIYPDRSIAPEQLRALVERVPVLRSAKIVPVDENLFTRPGPRVGETAAALNALLDRWERGKL